MLPHTHNWIPLLDVLGLLDIPGARDKCTYLLQEQDFMAMQEETFIAAMRLEHQSYSYSGFGYNGSHDE